MGLNHSPRIVTDGLVLCLDAANRKSYPGTGTAWADLSLSRTNSTLTNGPGYSTSNGGVITFDNTNDYSIISNASSIAGLTTYSAGLWINFDAASIGVDGRFFWHGNYGALIYKATDNRVRFYLRNSVSAVVQPQSDIVSASTWYYITGTYDGANVKLYMNGTFISSAALTGGVVNDLPQSIYLGGVPVAYWTACSMGQVTVYNKTLSDAEVLQNFNALRGRYGI
jgi:hypothetical protein